jgi:hypothetical protein
LPDDTPETREGPGPGGAAPDPPTVPPKQEEAPSTVQLDVEAAFPGIRRLKVLGAVLFVAAGVSAVLPILLLVDPEDFLGSRTLLALGLSVAGIAIGIAGLLSPGLRRPSIWLAPAVLVAAAAAGTPGHSLDRIPPVELVLALAFAASLLLAVEHLHAVIRFVELGAYITRQRLTTFRLASVVDHFQIYGAGLVALIGMVTAIVVVGIPWAFSKGSDPTLGRSVELASVFGVALAATVVFALSAIILVFVRSVVPQRVEVESVAYSRDRMEEMIGGSQSPGSRPEEGPGRRPE